MKSELKICNLGYLQLSLIKEYKNKIVLDNKSKISLMKRLKMNYLLGLDIGTSGVKALLVSPEGKIISSKTVSYPLKTPHSGWAEQSPYDWWDI